MLKTIGKFEDMFIVNLKLFFVIVLFNDSKSHVNLFIVLNGAILFINVASNSRKVQPG
jgi:hypothetical protein